MRTIKTLLKTVLIITPLFFVSDHLKSQCNCTPLPNNSYTKVTITGTDTWNDTDLTVGGINLGKPGEVNNQNIRFTGTGTLNIETTLKLQGSSNIIFEGITVVLDDAGITQEGSSTLLINNSSISTTQNIEINSGATQCVSFSQVTVGSQANSANWKNLGCRRIEGSCIVNSQNFDNEGDDEIINSVVTYVGNSGNWNQSKNTQILNNVLIDMNNGNFKNDATIQLIGSNTVYNPNNYTPGSTTGTGSISQNPGSLDFGTECSARLSLPVELSFFNARNVNGGNMLEWETLSEINNSHFEVQRSIDGKTFETISLVSGAGTTADAQQYNFKDSNPSSVTYYRLKQVDHDGNYEYSNVVMVISRSLRTQELQVYPNPAVNGYIRFHIPDDLEMTTIEIYDLLGRPV